MSDGLEYATIGELADRLRTRRLKSVDLVAATLERTRRLEPKLNTYITVLADQAMASARQADADIASGRYMGPMHGVPVSIKDHIDTAGIRTTAGARSRLSRVPVTDAPVARRIKASGAVLIGKANMNKFADGESGENPDFGTIHNPWGSDFSPGGSSSGSGAQVAAGLVPLSVGSDNGGSVRIPAALCGVVGLKPTHGRISLEGIFPRLYSLDHPGPLTRSVMDCAIAMEVLAGHDPGDGATARKPVPRYAHELATRAGRGIKGLKVGVDTAFVEVGQPDVLSAFEAAVVIFRHLGATVVDIGFKSFGDLSAVGNTIATCEYSVAAADLFREHPEDFKNAKPPAATPADVLAGFLVPAVDYIKATQARRLLQADWARAVRDVDVVLSPTYPMAPRPFGEYPRVGGRQYTAEDATHYTFAFDVLGVPAISVPCGISSAGCPVGLQIVARPFDELGAMTAAYAFEQATSWHTRRPPVEVPAPGA